jgi:hypothetical protein
MNKLQQTIATLKNPPSAEEFAESYRHAVTVLEAVQIFLTERQKNNCSSACSPLVAIAEGV